MIATQPSGDLRTALGPIADRLDPAVSNTLASMRERLADGGEKGLREVGQALAALQANIAEFRGGEAIDLGKAVMGMGALKQQVRAFYEEQARVTMLEANPGLSGRRLEQAIQGEATLRQRCERLLQDLPEIIRTTKPCKDGTICLKLGFDDWSCAWSLGKEVLDWGDRERLRQAKGIGAKASALFSLIFETGAPPITDPGKVLHPTLRRFWEGLEQQGFAVEIREAMLYIPRCRIRVGAFYIRPRGT